MQVSRGGWALAVMSLLTVVLLAPNAAGLAREVSGPSFPDALVGTASLLALAIAGWSLLTVALVLVGGSSRLVCALTPALLRRALLVGAAGVLVVGPAHAEQRVSPDLQQRHSVSGLPLPDRPSIDAVVRPAAADTPSVAPVEVRRGDTLWAIAARSLPPGADVNDIARATAAWHDANRDVIGDDPDLIFPTQRLVPPIGKDHP